MLSIAIGCVIYFAPGLHEEEAGCGDGQGFGALGLLCWFVVPSLGCCDLIGRWRLLGRRRRLFAFAMGRSVGRIPSSFQAVRRLTRKRSIGCDAVAAWATGWASERREAFLCSADIAQQRDRVESGMDLLEMGTNSVCRAGVGGQTLVWRRWRAVCLAHTCAVALLG